jgi:hypothetical protein
MQCNRHCKANHSICPQHAVELPQCRFTAACKSGDKNAPIVKQRGCQTGTDVAQRGTLRRIISTAWRRRLWNETSAPGASMHPPFISICHWASAKARRARNSPAQGIGCAPCAGANGRKPYAEHRSYTAIACMFCTPFGILPTVFRKAKQEHEACPRRCFLNGPQTDCLHYRLHWRETAAGLG